MTAAERLLFTTDTLVDHYEVIERTYEGRPSRVLFSGQRRAAQSGIGLDDNPDLLFDYNQRMLELASAVYPQRILMIGGGAFTLPMALRAALPQAVIDVVELDSGLEPIARDYFGLRLDDQLRVTYGDGRTFLDSSEQKYDLILVDAFNDLTIPQQFLTAQWTNLVCERLAADGVVGVNIIASIRGKNSGLVRSQLATYAQAFTRIDIFPAAHGLTGWLPQNLLLVAQVDSNRDFVSYLRFAPIEPLSFDEDDVRYD